MYFNLITIAPGREREAMHEITTKKEAFRDLNTNEINPYSDHQWLWKFFDEPKGTVRPFLFRRDPKSQIPRFYVVSKKPPKAPSDNWWVQTKEYSPKIEKSDCLRFMLCANPIVTTDSVRHDVVMNAKKRIMKEQGVKKWRDVKSPPKLYELVRQSCSEWLMKKAEKNGFQIVDPENTLAVDAYQPQAAQKKGEEDMRFSTVDFNGVLTVTEPDLFHKALMEGVGTARAFGCGLLLVRPL